MDRQPRKVSFGTLESQFPQVFKVARLRERKTRSQVRRRFYRGEFFPNTQAQEG